MSFLIQKYRNKQNTFYDVVFKQNIAYIALVQM